MNEWLFVVKQLTTNIGTSRDYEMGIATWYDYLAFQVRAFYAATGFH